MKHDLRGCRLERRVLLGNRLQLHFCGKDDEKDKRVLDLENVAGCWDGLTEPRELACLMVSPDSGSFGLDIALQLGRQEVQYYGEVMIFSDPECQKGVFRAAAERIGFREPRSGIGLLQ